jgi:hypothetical protein
MSFASRQERSSSAKKLVRLEYDAALFAQGDQAVSLESSRNWAAHIRQYVRMNVATLPAHMCRYGRSAGRSLPPRFRLVVHRTLDSVVLRVMWLSCWF